MAKKPRAAAVAVEQTTGEPSAQPIVRANINRQTVDAAEFVSLYVNDTQVQLTPWDVRFIFGVISETPTENRPTILIKTIGEVRMSPQHAKRVAMVLLQQLKHYEDTVGPIPQPD